MKVEVRIPISPTPHFFRQVEYLWRSFRANGGLAANAKFVVSVGEDCEPYDLYELNEWSRGSVEWHWVDREEFRHHFNGKQKSYAGTGLDRFKHDTDADVVLLSDADTLLIRPVDDLLEALVARPAIAGVMAYLPPHIGLDTTWEKVMAAAGKPLPPALFQHTAWGGLYADPKQRFGPAYFNFGAVYVPGQFLKRLGEEHKRQLEISPRAPIHPQFKDQFAFTLAIYELGLPHVALEIRYNFPNDVWANRIARTDLFDVRLIHYLQENVIGTRRGTWGSDDAFNVFLCRTDLRGANEVLRRTAATLHAHAAGEDATRLERVIDG